MKEKKYSCLLTIFTGELKLSITLSIYRRNEDGDMHNQKYVSERLSFKIKYLKHIWNFFTKTSMHQ